MTIYQPWESASLETTRSRDDRAWDRTARRRGPSFYPARGKRLLDIVLAAALLALLAVPLSLVALLLLVSQGRPIFYAGRRMKTPEQPFRQFKFRTMMRDDDDGGATGGHKHWRITRVGRFLRRTRIDELPQLFNILVGDMSFVGPRPPLPEYVARFPAAYAEVLAMRPGVTGLATLIYHRHEDKILATCDTAAATERAYYARCLPTKLRIDQIYREASSLRLDLWIMWKTMLAVIPGLDLPRRRRR